ncbi:MAG: SMC family ATPase [Candidatus Thermoplasmatota archaeon]
MRIESLHIRNFRRFALVDLELPDGVTALVGRNGAGKSTLLEALGWCLYGNEAARTGKDLIKRRGAAAGDDVRVRLAFRFGAHVYEVTRELLGKGESHVATVTVDGSVVVNAGAQSAKEATAYVARLFHMDREAFFTSLVARQSELAMLTDIPAGQRKRILIGLLRLDAVDGAIVEARSRKRNVRAELMGLRSVMHDASSLRMALDVARGAVEGGHATLVAADGRIAALVDEVEDVRQRREASRKRAEEYRHVALLIASAAERVGTLARDRDRRVAELAQSRAAAAQALALGSQLEALPLVKERCEALAALRIRHEELSRTTRELAAAESEAARASSEHETAIQMLAGAGALAKQAERVAVERQRSDARLTDARMREAEASVRAKEEARLLSEVEAKAARVREVGPESPCPTCLRPLREHHSELLHGFASETEQRRAALAVLSPILEDARREAAESSRSLVDLAAREQEIQRKAAQLGRAEAQRDAAAYALASATGRAADLRARASALQAAPFEAQAQQSALAELRRLEALSAQRERALAVADRADEIVRILTELEEAEKAASAAHADAKRRSDALRFDPAAHEALERAAEAAEARLGEARLLRERAQGELQRRLDEERRLLADIAQQEALAARATVLEARVTLLEHLAGDRDNGLLPEFKDHLIGRIRPMLSAHAGRLFRELTEGRYADLEVADDYDLLVHDEGQAFGLARFSGGESDLANLCLRLAVSQVVAERAGTEGFGFLALDEVFGSQDEVRKGNILRALKGLSGRFRQIVLITHIDDIKDAAENVIRVRALDDGTSECVVEGAG